jgi:hypothetical protein
MSIAMPASRRVAAWAISLALLGGCANTSSFKKPQDIVWMDPAPEQSVLYLFRAPHDSTEVVAFVNGAAAARLPASAYTALTLPPGTYGLATAGTGTQGLNVELKAGERRFVYVSGVMATHTQAIGLATAFAGPLAGLAVMAGNPTDLESRRWTECSDLDARGLASIGTFVAPSVSSQ